MNIRKTKILLFACFLSLSIGLPISCKAQIDTIKSFEKNGFVFGFAIGASYINLNYANYSTQKQFSASFPNFKIGGMINERTALLLYLPGSIYTFKDSGRIRDRGFEGIVPSIQYWFSKKFWVLAGAGLGMDAPAFYDIKSEEERKFYFGGTYLGSLGYEILQTKKMAFDIQSRFQYGVANMPDGKRKGYSISVLLGLNLN